MRVLGYVMLAEADGTKVKLDRDKVRQTITKKVLLLLASDDARGRPAREVRRWKYL